MLEYFSMFKTFFQHACGQKMKKSNLKNSLDLGQNHLLQHQNLVITKQKVKLLMKLYQ